MIDFTDLYKRAESSLCYVASIASVTLKLIDRIFLKKNVAFDVDSYQMRLSKRLLYLTLNVNIVRMHVQSVLAIKIIK